MPTTPRSVVPPTVQADTLNWMLEQITRLNDLTVEGAEYEQVPGGRQLRIPKTPVGFWARVLRAAGSGGGSEAGSGNVCQPYDWWEQEPLGCGYFQDDEFGRTGTLEDGDPAYSIPPDAFVPEDSIVWLTKGLAIITPESELSGSGSGAGGITEPVIQEWYFQLGGGGSDDGGSGSGAGGGVKISSILECQAGSGSGGGTLSFLDGCLTIRNGKLVLLDGAGNVVDGSSCP